MRYALYHVMSSILIGLAATTAAVAQPAWVKQRPAAFEYYHGVAVASVSPDHRDHLQKAKNAALADLASEISVSIESGFLRNVVESQGLLEDSVRSALRALTRADLEGYELVDTWTSPSEYWIYYRLSRSEYARWLEARKTEAAEMALDRLDRARRLEQEGETALALQSGLAALHALEAVLGDAIEVTRDGGQVFVVNEVHAFLEALLNTIDLSPAVAEISVKTGRTDTALDAVATHRNGAPIAGLPIRFSFVDGRGTVIGETLSDRDGVARGRLLGVRSSDPVQVIQTDVDLERMLGAESTSLVMKSVLNGLPRSAATIRLIVARPVLHLTTIEMNLGRAPDVPLIGPTVKEALFAAGFSIGEDSSSADARIELHVETRPGPEVSGMYTVFADASISVTDSRSRSELFTTSLKGVRGLHLDHRSAGTEALRRAAERLRDELITQLINHFQ